eukprot:CAMPEP_0183346976 /NCGR_PEP_ID=MMETSP0164_2-20130417/11937_1 /TAXON_ID=221442 /ORGANISM="Coccolithus pelagicus ssp braarudi, Strain PLY182g" /LENGTH=90 /DNA_ID=CAMNT_0025518337 /DNA_START=113 /DNA_END=381 /DNA_ORIENTATION=+
MAFCGLGSRPLSSAAVGVMAVDGPYCAYDHTPCTYAATSGHSNTSEWSGASYPPPPCGHSSLGAMRWDGSCRLHPPLQLMHIPVITSLRR